MATKIKIESGLQLLARLTKTVNLSKFYPILFEEGLQPNATLEIYGDTNCCKSLLVTDIVCQTLIPVELGGLGIAILLFSTDGNFHLDTLFYILKRKIKTCANERNITLDNDQLDIKVGAILGNLYLVEIFDVEQFYTTIENLENILIDNPNISLIIFDTLTAFYWSEQQFKLMKMDYYIRKILKTIKKITKEYKTPLIYTKPEYFASKPDNGIESLETMWECTDYKIHITLCEDIGDNITYKVIKQTTKANIVRYICVNKGNILWM